MPAWVQLVAPIVTILGVAVWIVCKLDRTDSRLHQIQLAVAAVEHQNRALLKAFPQVISSLMAAKLMKPEQGSQLIATALDAASVTELLGKIQPSANPLPLEDLNRLRNYVGRLRQGDWLTPQEAQDFYRLTDTVSREYPSNEGSWLLFLVGGMVLGLILAGQEK
jgi:hypothetical protein